MGDGVYERRAAVTDEGGKLNPNALIAIDKTGEVLYNALIKLPPLENNPEIADAIVDWVDSDDNQRTAGAESAHYQGLNPPYRAKNGALNSLDEMLLIKGVTPQLLYGTDRNRNGDADDGGGGSVDRGLIDYITVHSRELNVDSTGTLRIWINGDDVKGVYDALIPAVGKEMAAYSIGAKLYGTTRLDAQGNPISGGGGGGKKGKQQKVRVGDTDELIAAVEKSLEDASTSGKAIASVTDLMSTRITLPRTSGSSGGGGAFGTPQQETVVVNCPLNDQAKLNDLLPPILDKVATKEAVEMVPRLNVNTAPREVLLGLPGLADTDVDAILNARDGVTVDDPAYSSGAWLVTAANLPAAKFKAPNSSSPERRWCTASRPSVTSKAADRSPASRRSST